MTLVRAAVGRRRREPLPAAGLPVLQVQVAAEPAAPSAPTRRAGDRAAEPAGQRVQVHRRREGRSRLRAFAADGSVCLEVERQRHRACPPARAKRIFDRFYQVDQPLSRRAGGCGLGLSIVKFIVDAHGGTVDVRQRAGQGQHVHGAAARGSLEPPGRRQVMPGETVLIVEDDPTMLRGLKDNFEFEGYRVVDGRRRREGPEGRAGGQARPDRPGHHAAEGQRLRDLPADPRGRGSTCPSSC